MGSVASTTDSDHAATKFRQMMEGEMQLAPGQGKGWREVYRIRVKG